MKDFAWIAKL